MLRPNILGQTLITVVLMATGAEAQSSWAQLERDLEGIVSRAPAEIGLALVALEGDHAVWLQADLRMHAASTMKVPVLIELSRQVDQDHHSWSDTVTIHNDFKSIVDGSSYQLTVEDDSDSTLYLRTGEAVSYRELAERMIVRSSNLATNILIERLGAPETQATARALGADSIEVLRGVEDIKAFRQGLSNTTTARDLALLMKAIATGRAASPEATSVMLEILEGQEFQDLIPAGLPSGTRVANKTGWITGVVHDAAIVWPSGCAPYVLVVLTRGFDEYQEAATTIAQISRRVYDGLGCRS